MWPDLLLARSQSNLEKCQTKILGPASVIWDQIFEIWPQEGQHANPGLKPFLTDHAIACGVNGLTTTIVTITISRKVRFYKRYPLWRNKGAVRLLQPWDCTMIRIFDISVATSDILSWHQMWCSQINFWCLMFCRQMWCWLGCCFLSTFLLISGRK